MLECAHTPAPADNGLLGRLPRRRRNTPQGRLRRAKNTPETRREKSVNNDGNNDGNNGGIPLQWEVEQMTGGHWTRLGAEIVISEAISIQ